MPRSCLIKVNNLNRDWCLSCNTVYFIFYVFAHLYIPVAIAKNQNMYNPNEKCNVPC